MVALSSRSAVAPDVGGRAAFHIPSLDGLRAVSFFLVFAAHAGLERIVPGGFGVTVFFFLSGYLITTLLRIEEGKNGRINLRNFYVRRALRILPPFYIILFAAIALAETGFVKGSGRPEGLPIASQLLHFSNYWIAIHGWNGIPTGTGVYWSLAVEEHFYLIFPAVYIGLGQLRLTGRTKAYVFWGSCALVLVWRCVLVYFLHAVTDRTYLCSDTRIDSIAFGCALACWRNPALDGVDRGAGVAAPWRAILLPAGIVLLFVTFLVRGPFFRETFRYTLQGIGLTPIFLTAVRSPKWFVFRALNSRPLQFLGTLSYSLYLVHQIVLAAFAEHSPLGGVVRAAAAFFVSVAIAWAMYRFVEKPCAKLRRRLSAQG